MNNKNPHNICSLDEKSDCSGCNNKDVLHCKWDIKVLAAFLLMALSFMIPAIMGLVIAGFLIEAWWPLISYIAFMVLFFGFFEIYILCSHCPFYAKEGPFLECLANHGMPKLWPYRPGPMSKFEKTSLLLCFSIFALFPDIIQGYGLWTLINNFETYGVIACLGVIGVLIATILSCIAFFYTLSVYYCPKCINFACPLNSAPKEAVNYYLKKNSVIKEAMGKSVSK